MSTAKLNKLNFTCRYYRALIFFSSFVYLIIAMQLPVTISPGAMHDDALFFRHAYDITQGEWLGPYNQFTLAKGIGFSLVLAVNAILGIPITLFLAIFYLMASFLFVESLKKTGLHATLAALIFLILLFHPAHFPTHIIRDNIYPGLFLLVFTGALSITFNDDRRDILYWKKLIGYGLCLGLFLITREEYIWVFPGLIFFFFMAALYVYKKNSSVKVLATSWTIFFVVGFSVPNLVSIVNYFKYGVYASVDFKEKEFSNVLKNLNSIVVENEKPNLPVPYKKRVIIYEISPTFAQLRDYFENTGKGWTLHGCHFYPWTCGDYAGGWFMWALRDAVASTGNYKSASEAIKFYKNINREVVNACASHKIKCEQNLIPFMPNITKNQLRAFPHKLLIAIKMAIWRADINLTHGPSDDPQSRLNKVRIFLGNPKSVASLSEESSTVTGWFYSKKDAWVEIDCAGKKIEPQRQKSEDIALHFNDKNAVNQRLNFTIQGDDNCFISQDNNIAERFELTKDFKGSHIFEDGSELYIDDFSSSKINDVYKTAFSVKTFLIELYAHFIPILAILGFVAYLVNSITLFFNDQRITPIFIVATSLWILFFTRIILLVMVDISSFPALFSIYISAAFSIICVVPILSAVSFWESFMKIKINKG